MFGLLERIRAAGIWRNKERCFIASAPRFPFMACGDEHYDECIIIEYDLAELMKTRRFNGS
jgi:hypothetical protein